MTENNTSYPTKITEKMADLEHEQWMKWAQSLMDSEELSPGRIERWMKYMIPYNELDNKTQEYDRVWARKVLDIIYDTSPTTVINEEEE